MTKRALPEAESSPWFLRVARLRPASEANRYGDRFSLPVADFCSGRADLAACSLIIPAFTRRRDIPSTKDAQRRTPWLWNAYEHVRFFGLLDVDMDVDPIFAGTATLFTDAPAPPGGYPKKKHVKKHFAERLRSGCPFGTLLAVCPAFADLYQAIRALTNALVVPHVAFFSGGGGFRVLFHSDAAWRRVMWGQGYAAAFHSQQLAGLLRLVAPMLGDEGIARIMAGTDKNVYDSDKGVKPDLLAHFDTGIFPHPLTPAFESAFPSRDQSDAGLSAAIRAFWKHVFQSIPDDPPQLRAPPTEPALTAEGVPVPVPVPVPAFAYPYETMAGFFVLGPRRMQFSKPGAGDKGPAYSYVNPHGTIQDVRAQLGRRGYLSAHISAVASAEAQLEFAVDIDLQDYDKVRPALRTAAVLGCQACAGSKGACRHCWLLIELARVALGALLTDVCGLGRPLVVFSGSKGAHFWFGNARARALTFAQRQTLAEELARWATREGRDALDRQHPLVRALCEAWERLAVAGRGIIRRETLPWLGSFLPSDVARDALNLAASVDATSRERWDLFCAIAAHAGVPDAPARVALEVGLPVVDRKLYDNKHTLRMPFSVHAVPPHRLTLPLTEEMLHTCDPSAMPTAQTVTAAQREAAVRVTQAWFTECGYLNAGGI